jgi:type II secretory pathway pseudopilin PulG
MVVIVMISLLAIMAVPAMKTARDDRMVFDYARQIQGIIHRAEIRSMSRGAAHLVILDTAGGTRGTAMLFEAVDFTPAPNGPKPVSSCRGQRDPTNGTFINHWAEAQAWVPGGANPVRSPLVDGVNMNGPGVETGMNLFAVLSEQTAGTVPTIAICYTPGGTVYVGTGANATAAINAMRIAAPYTQSLQVELARHDAANTVLGLRRRVILAGGAAPRIVSQ